MNSILLQKVFWHIRWIITVLGIIHCCYFILISTTYGLEKFIGFNFLLLFICMIFYQLEKYVECLSNCPISKEKRRKNKC